MRRETGGRRPGPGVRPQETACRPPTARRGLCPLRRKPPGCSSRARSGRDSRAGRSSKDRGKQSARERQAAGGPSACPTARAVTPDTRNDGAKTTKYATGVCSTSLASRLSPSGPIPDPSSVRRWTRSGSAAGPPQGTIRVHEEHGISTRSGHRSIASPSSPRSTQRTRRGHADEPSRIPLTRLWRRPSDGPHAEMGESVCTRRGPPASQ